MTETIKVYTRKPRLYRGDKTIQIMAQLPNGVIGLMNLTPIYFNRKKQYSNDLNGIIFETITKAKLYCKKFYDLEKISNIPAK